MNNPRKRVRVNGAVGFVDPPSDEEIEVNINATSNSVTGQIKYDYSTSSLKRVKKLPAGTSILRDVYATPPESGPASESVKNTLKDSSEQSDPKEEQKRKQGASVMMSIFEKVMPTLHASLLAREYDQNLGRSCACGSPEAIYRCRSCTHSPLRCKLCILNDHHHTPWHHIDGWVGTHFARTSLHHLGYRYRLGHDGGTCPNRGEKSNVQSIVVVHSNGFHKTSVEFCACHHSTTSADQFLKADLFPASFEHPETVFTFELLDMFEKLSLKSKINAYDYHLALQEMTNAAFPQDVPNRYHEFVRVYRVWNHMAQVRRSGQCHSFDDALTYRRKGSVTVRCPACPEVHFNLDQKTLELAGEDEAHKYTLFISADGNFKLQRKNKHGDPDDVSLNNGRGYFVADAPYRAYLSHVGECHEDCICTHLRVIKFRNVIRFKNAVVSGVIVIQCARHGFYLPQGIADLVRSEAFRNTDYVIAYSLADAQYQRWIMLSYDIFCSYHINLEKRFAKYFPNMLPVVKKMRGAIPKLHIKNHIEACQYQWAFNFLPYSGETVGEMIEGSHSEQNGAAASTKEMNAGHRHDSLDGIINYWNWTKFHGMGASLYRSFIKCLDTLKTREKSFIEYSARFKTDVLAKWEAIDDMPRIVNKKVISVHRPNFNQRPPTQAKAHQKLMHEEYVRELAGTGTIGEAATISKGLNLERNQLSIQSLAAMKDKSEADNEKLLNGRQKLRDDLVKWREKQFDLFPLLIEESKITSVDYLMPENERLLLPSEFSEACRIRLGLQSAAKAEYQIREGRAHDCLDDVRRSIQTYNHHVSIKANDVHGQRYATRARSIVDNLNADTQKAANAYNFTRNALLKLGLDPTDPLLKPLLPTELWAKNAAMPPKLGDSRKQDPWFWHVACPAGLSAEEQAEFYLENDRVKWFRERSLRNRAREEREILEEEFKRVICSYNQLHSVWISQGKKQTEQGSRAYAYKQAAMLERLSRDCTETKNRALKKAEVYDKWFSDYILSR